MIKYIYPFGYDARGNMLFRIGVVLPATAMPHTVNAYERDTVTKTGCVEMHGYWDKDTFTPHIIDTPQTATYLFCGQQQKISIEPSDAAKIVSDTLAAMTKE